MKILIDARSMGTKPSGIGMYIYNFAKELVKEPDMEIHLLSDIATSNEMQAMEQAGEGEDPCHAGAAPERPPMDDETKETDVQRAAFESDVLRGVVMSEVLTRPSERAALRRMKRGRRA